MSTPANGLAAILLTIGMSTSTLADTAIDKAASSDPTKLPIVLTFFLHDELTNRDFFNMERDYLPWFITDLEGITGRKVTIKSVLKKPGYTDFDYRLGDADKTLYEWDQRVSDYVVHNSLPRDRRYKYLLITRHDLTFFTAGIAYQGKRSAVVSLTAYRTIAHEVGHLLGAEHGHGRVVGSGFPVACYTNMLAAEVPFIRNCYRYSDPAGRAIRSYLENIP